MILFFPRNKLSRLVNVSIFSIAYEKDRVAVNTVADELDQGRQGACGPGMWASYFSTLEILQ